jgi:hypothetical protein
MVLWLYLSRTALFAWFNVLNCWRKHRNGKGIVIYIKLFCLFNQHILYYMLTWKNLDAIFSNFKVIMENMLALSLNHVL